MNLDAILQDFEQSIIERGSIYFDNERVASLEEISPDTYEAVVEGTEPYSVSVSVDADGLAAFDCDCPYRNAPYCKHVVAVLLAIQERSAHAPVTANDQMADNDTLSVKALDALSKKTLVSLLRSIMLEFPQSKDWLLAQLGSAKDEIQSYRRLIRSSINDQMERGYVPYRFMSRALHGSEAALSRLEDLTDSPAIFHTLDFAEMLLTETMTLFHCGDDSDGSVGGAIEECLDALDELFEKRVQKANKQDRTNYFKRLMAMVASPLFRGWDDWNERLLNQCMQIADGIPSLQKPILDMHEQNMCISNENDEYAVRYARENAQEAYFRLLSRWNGNEAALAFAASHMENEAFRSWFFSLYCKNRQYAEAINLCLESEKKAGHFNGSAESWKKRRFTIYELTHDEDSQRKLGEELLLGGDIQYYPKLKLLYAETQWVQKRVELLEKLKEIRTWSGSVYLRIITDEVDKPRIFAYASSHTEQIFTLYSYLLPEYSEAVCAMFQKELRKHADRATDRKSYQNVCSKLLIYAAACGAALANEILGAFQTKYAHRPAFQDELQKIISKISRPRNE